MHLEQVFSPPFTFQSPDILLKHLSRDQDSRTWDLTEYPMKTFPYLVTGILLWTLKVKQVAGLKETCRFVYISVPVSSHADNTYAYKYRKLYFRKTLY